MTTLYFVRHGQSVANLTHYCACQLDAPLTDLGRQQALCTAEFLKDIPFTAVYASDLSRAYDTGVAIARRHGLVVKKHIGLREICGGAWEGLSYEEVSRRYPEDYQSWMNHIGLASPTEGESLVSVQQRMKKAVAEIVSAHPEEHVCVASHAIAIRTLSCLWHHMALEQLGEVPWTRNASVTIVEYDTPASEGRLIAYDMCDHLKDLSTKFPSNI